MKEKIKLIPIDQIRILNPRHRDQKKFELIVQSIKNLGLKKPIQISLRSLQEIEGPGYDLVCGQGRIEAFLALGHKEIPALIVEVSKEERMLRSLVENMARRFPDRMDLLHEIERLKDQGYSNAVVANKLDISEKMVCGFIALKNAGEERLLDWALSGKIPLGIAMDIARTDTIDTQRELLKAYEKKQLNQASIRTIKRLIEQRRFLGRQRGPTTGVSNKGRNAQGLVSAYRKEIQRQKFLVRKARLCEAKLLFLVTAFRKLIADKKFANLLRAESLSDMPKYLWEKIDQAHKEAA